MGDARTAALEVSVVIPVYNAAPFVADAVASALRCSEVRQVLLVEDGSKDDSLAVCRRLAASDPRIVLLRHPGGVNRGASSSRNLGIEHATSPFVAFLDADDSYLPGRFDAERRIFVEVPDADGVYGALGIQYHSALGRQRFETQYGGATLTTVVARVPPEELLRSLVLRKGFGHFHLNALTVKRTALDRLNGPFREIFHEDTDLIYRLAHHARLYPGSIEAPVALRGVHDDNRITTNSDPAGTNMVLYDGLCRWADAVEGVAEDVKAMFRAKLLLARSAKARSIGERWRIGRGLWKHRAQLTPYERKHAFLRLITGPSIHALLHRAFRRRTS
jgi:glycosyltransferase involved in cell wall biosynthesis